MILLVGLLAQLVNFQCQETIDRYRNDQPIDTITATVSFESGREDYQNVRLNGKHRKSIESLGGLWTVFDFGTIEQHPDTQWVIIVGRHQYIVPFEQSDKDGVLIRHTIGVALPPRQTYIEWGVRHELGPVPVDGWFKVVYDTGDIRRNTIKWSDCKKYRSVSKLLNR